MSAQVDPEQPDVDLTIQREQSLFNSVDADASKIVFELQREMIRANRYQRPLSVVLFGTEVNDGAARNTAMGRRTQLLRRVQARAGAVLRQTDHFGRLDEAAVLVVLPETDAMGAEIVAQRLLAGGNTPLLIAQARKSLSRIFVSWREVTPEDCDVARFLNEMDEAGLEFDEFASRPVVLSTC